MAVLKKKKGRGILGIADDVMGNLPGAPPTPQINVGGYTPDYTSIIQNDPILQGLLRGWGADDIADKSTRDAAIRRALTNLGGSVDYHSLGIDDELIDPATQAGIDASNEGGTSILSQIMKAYGQNRSANADSLAGTGMYDSGQLKFTEDNLNSDKLLQEYNARQATLDAIAGVHGTYTGNVRGRANLRGGAYTDAAARARDLYPPTPGHPIGHVPMPPVMRNIRRTPRRGIRYE